MDRTGGAASGEHRPTTPSLAVPTSPVSETWPGAQTTRATSGLRRATRRGPRSGWTAASDPRGSADPTSSPQESCQRRVPTPAAPTREAGTGSARAIAAAATEHGPARGSRQFAVTASGNKGPMRSSASAAERRSDASSLPTNPNAASCKGRDGFGNWDIARSNSDLRARTCLRSGPARSVGIAVGLSSI